MKVQLRALLETIFIRRWSGVHQCNTASLKYGDALPKGSRAFSLTLASLSRVNPQAPSVPTDSAPDLPKSSCVAGIVMPGLNYLKDQPPVVAVGDKEYPSWLWTILQPKLYPPEEQGLGGAAQKARHKKERKEKIRAQNFMRTQ
ncbi:mitochondrial ribosomal protein L37-domain-containing protein [Cantharellus anzutake]|uniref:mitochondrial ribosomal protein L37-domain-containing protein n=1 Tax=Cantharellus anzutake TaxID=1750568 RepID=UPI0019074383|nr:mitochondrial ribosomal protein L37-domain-containing protein [Cantharellus anzutake]KAF8327234.1 mitochondrial ribosomal protein L37-domain-containing protein [Cantharellus anzutake]